MIDTKELRSMVNGAQFESFANSVINALLDRLEAVEKEYRHALELKEMYQHQLNETEKENDALRAMIQVALVVLDEVCGNINPERGYADELETDVKRAIAAISLYNTKGEEK